MSGRSLTVCGQCGARTDDPSQSTCPNCLEPLQVKTFGSEASLEAFREDRRAHGAPVPDEDRTERRPGLALAFAFTATIMLLAAGGIVFHGAVSGSLGRTTYAIGQAVVPAAMGLGMAVLARKYGGTSA